MLQVIIKLAIIAVATITLWTPSKASAQDACDVPCNGLTVKSCPQDTSLSCKIVLDYIPDTEYGWSKTVAGVGYDAAWGAYSKAVGMSIGNLTTGTAVTYKLHYGNRNVYISSSAGRYRNIDCEVKLPKPDSVCVAG